jgi:hypothetical protein
MNLLVKILSADPLKPDSEFVNALLGSRNDMAISDKNWYNFMVAVSIGISAMLNDMKSLL